MIQFILSTLVFLVQYMSYSYLFIYMAGVLKPWVLRTFSGGSHCEGQNIGDWTWRCRTSL